MRRSILGAFVNAWMQTARLQRIAELHAEEGAGAVAGDAEVVPVGEDLHHAAVGVEDLGRDRRVDAVQPVPEASREEATSQAR